MTVTAAEIKRVAALLKPHVLKTPLLRSTALERRVGSRFPLYLKAENLQYTGSFKARGALNKLFSLTETERKQGVITASAGNHAQGVAYHAKNLGIDAKIIMPETTPLNKVNSTRQWGATIVLQGETYQESFEHALTLQKTEGRIYVHAFDDEEVIAGQGTLAEEVLEDLPECQVFLAPMGGGGLLAGCGLALKARNSETRIVAVQADGCSNFLPSLAAHSPVTLTSAATIAEGMAVKKLGTLTFDICRQVVDQTVLVSDEEIAEGVLWLLENERLFVEGCGGATVAALIKAPELVTGPTVIVLSGGNLDVNLLARLIDRGLAKAGRLMRLQLQIADRPGALHRLSGVFAEEKASIVHVSHERIFGDTSLREVLVRVILETQGFEHNERVTKALGEKGFSYKVI